MVLSTIIRLRLLVKSRICREMFGLASGQATKPYPISPSLSWARRGKPGWRSAAGWWGGCGKVSFKLVLLDFQILQPSEPQHFDKQNFIIS